MKKSLNIVKEGNEYIHLASTWRHSCDECSQALHFIFFVNLPIPCIIVNANGRSKHIQTWWLLYGVGLAHTWATWASTWLSSSGHTAMDCYIGILLYPKVKSNLYYCVLECTSQALWHWKGIFKLLSHALLFLEQTPFLLCSTWKTSPVKPLYKVLEGFIPLLSGKAVQWVGFRSALTTPPEPSLARALDCASPESLKL